MSERQYIGARYVPKFFANGSGTAEWVANTQYEALTVVTRNGNSYTSRIPVPASVGAPEDNPDYWASTGLFNSQVEEYREEVQAVQSDVDGLKTTVYANKILFVGDSYNTIYDNAGWDLKFIEKAGLEDGDYFRINIGGLGFATEPNSWVDALNNRLSLIEDKELYKAVIVCGGTNDRERSLSAIKTGMNNFKTIVNNNFPNAKMYVGYLGWSGIPSQHANFRTALNNYIDACSSLGIAYLYNVEYVLHWYPYLRDNTAEVATDYFHPTIIGLTALGEKIFDAYNSGMCDVKYTVALTMTPYGTKVTNIGDQDSSVTIHNGVTTVSLSGLNLTFADTVSAGSGATIGTFACDCFRPQYVYLLENFLDVSALTGGVVNFGFNNGNVVIGPYVDIAAHNQKLAPVIWTYPTETC